MAWIVKLLCDGLLNLQGSVPDANNIGSVQLAPVQGGNCFTDSVTATPQEGQCPPTPSCIVCSECTAVGSLAPPAWEESGFDGPQFSGSAWAQFAGPWVIAATHAGGCVWSLTLIQGGVITLFFNGSAWQLTFDPDGNGLNVLTYLVGVDTPTLCCGGTVTASSPSFSGNNPPASNPSNIHLTATAHCCGSGGSGGSGTDSCWACGTGGLPAAPEPSKVELYLVPGDVGVDSCGITGWHTLTKTGACTWGLTLNVNCSNGPESGTISITATSNGNGWDISALQTFPGGSWGQDYGTPNCVCAGAGTYDVVVNSGNGTDNCCNLNIDLLRLS